MPMDEDLSVFFETDGFADAATLDGHTVHGIFDNPSDDPLGMDTRGPRFRLPSADCASLTSASTLVLRGTTYRVRGGWQHDGTGLCMLWLERS